MNRRRFLVGAAATVAAAPFAHAAPGPAVLGAAWALWKERHLDPSGRVVDALQGGASHSEGQGYALALAALIGDLAAAERLIAWTDANLVPGRSDGLLAWRWFPDGGVRDRNNASDGDVFFAWGLLHGGRAFRKPEWIARAKTIAAAVADICVVPDPRRNGRVLLLPGAEGFAKDSGITVNPSYLMPRLMEDLADAANRPELGQAARDGVALLADLAAEGTTPDWIEIGRRGTRPAATLSDRTGYEAIRTPLFLVWSGLADHPMVARHRAVIAASNPRPLDIATVFERRTGAVIERSGDVGYLAAASLLGCGQRGVGDTAIPIAPFGASQPYYPATLHMMTLVAQIQRAPACIPL